MRYYATLVVEIEAESDEQASLIADRTAVTVTNLFDIKDAWVDFIEEN
jgi:hypothetical protein